MSIKVLKNLFQTISTFAVVMFIDLCLMVGYIYSLFMEQPNYGWIILLIILASLCLYFIIGFYWIFQKVVIDEKGIKIVFLGKTLSHYNYDNVEHFVVGVVMRNPATIIYTKDNKRLHIDRRKKALDCLKFYNVKQHI